MKVKVIKRFKDKYTGERYFPGDLFEGEAARIKELKTRAFVEIPKEEEPEKALDYTAFTKKELAQILDKQGIEYSMKDKKDELISLLGGE